MMVFILSKGHAEDGSEDLHVFLDEAKLRAAMLDCTEAGEELEMSVDEAISAAKTDQGQYGVSWQFGWGAPHIFICEAD